MDNKIKDMNILASPNKHKYYDEKTRKSISLSKSNKTSRNWEEIGKDIAENMYLILFSVIPLIFYPVFAYSPNESYNIVEEMLLNPDLMLLPIPYILHCMLSISSKKEVYGKRIIIGSCFIIVVLALLFYLVLKLNIISGIVGKIFVIWGGILTTIILSIIGSVKSYSKETITT